MKKKKRGKRNRKVSKKRKEMKPHVFYSFLVAIIALISFVLMVAYNSEVTGRSIFEFKVVKEMCYDSDNGLNYREIGTCMDNTGTYTDKCIYPFSTYTKGSDIVLREYYCNKETGKCESVMHKCKCRDRVCK